MKKAIRFIASLAILLVCVLALGLTAGASGDFSVRPVLPENQVPETTSFFDMNVTSGTRQEIAVTVANTRDQPITVEMSLFAPSTSLNGSINYTASGRHDERMAHSFEDIAHLPGGNEVTVAPNSSLEVPIIIDIPAGGFDGIILGSVHALLGITEEEIAEAGMIVNRFAVAIPVRLRGNDINIETNFILGETDIGTFNHRAAIIAEIHNPQPRLTMGTVVNAQVITAAGETVFTVENMQVDFAPYAIFPLTMEDSAGVGVASGDYTIEVQIAHEDKVWDFTQDFHIEAAEADQVNQAAVNQPHFVQEDDSALSPWIIILIIAVVLLAAQAAILLIKSSKVKNKELELLRKQVEAKRSEEQASNSEEKANEIENQISPNKQIGVKED